MEKEIPSTSTIQKGRKMKKEKIKVANRKIKKKYLSIIFVCIFMIIAGICFFAKSSII